MSNILISTESRFPVNRKILRQTVENFLAEQKIKTEIEVSIAVVGDRKMASLNKKYRHLEGTTPVLSFSLSDSGTTAPFATPPDNILRLGDIVVSYPQAVLMAASENKLVDQKIGELVKHGLSNLFGINNS